MLLWHFSDYLNISEAPWILFLCMLRDVPAWLLWYHPHSNIPWGGWTGRCFQITSLPTQTHTSLSRDTDTFYWGRVTMSVFHIITRWLERTHTWERGPPSFSRPQIHLLFSQKRSHSIWWVQAAAAWAHFLFQMVTFAVMFDVKTETPRYLSELSLETSNLHDWPQAKEGKKIQVSYFGRKATSSTLQYERWVEASLHMLKAKGPLSFEILKKGNYLEKTMEM